MKMKTFNIINKLVFGCLLTFTFSLSNATAQNDTMFVLNQCTELGKYNVNEVDSIIFYEPYTQIQTDTMYILKQGTVWGKHKTSEIDSIIFYNSASIIADSIDCLDANYDELIVPGDSYQVNPDFHGYADPSIRKDPNSDTLWFSYSFPHYKLHGTDWVPSVSIHLSKSLDNGVTWSFEKKLFEPIAMNNPANTSQEGFLDHETVNLIPVSYSGEEFWCAARLNYFIPKIGGFAARPNNSFHISIIKASTPSELTNGNVGTIGGNFTHSTWNVNSTLIPPDLISTYFFWNEPGLYFDSTLNKLYLVMAAFAYNGSLPDLSKSNVYVYSTVPDGNPDTWAWTYNGKLVGESEANELGGQKVTQTDISKGIDGKLLLICTPDDYNDTLNDYNHKGCRVVEIKSLETPKLERDCQGNLKVRVSISASDSNELGSGASAYDPSSVTGILFTKRIKTSTNLTANIRKTLLKP